jgi:alkylhydroperoxidase family enzyme
MSARIPLPSDAELPPAIAAELSRLPPLNVLRMMANVPDYFPALVNLISALFHSDAFEPRAREIVVLRVAHITRTTYEWHQNVQFAKNVGMTADEIALIGTDGPVMGLDEEGNLLCRVADEITRDVRLSDEALEQLLARYGSRRATAAILMAGWFNLLSRFLQSTRVELEPGDLTATRTGPL